MLATVAAADSAKVQKKKYSVFIYSEAEPHAMYVIYKQTRTLCVLQYLAKCRHANITVIFSYLSARVWGHVDNVSVFPLDHSIQNSPDTIHNTLKHTSQWSFIVMDGPGS